MVRLISIALTGVMTAMLGTYAQAAALRVDPTQPPAGFAAKSAVSAAKPTKGEQFQLQQILITEDQAVAIINNKTVRTGDKLEGFRVKAISKKRVKLQSSQQTIDLRMFPEQIKE